MDQEVAEDIESLKRSSFFESEVHIKSLRGGITNEQAASQTLRHDITRAVIEHAYTFHDKVALSWEYYLTDSLLNLLVNRSVQFACNGFSWELPDKPSPLAHPSVGRSPDKKRQEVFWNTWSSEVNDSVDNVLPGLDEVMKWLYKNLILSHMVVIHWMWDTMVVDGVTYEVPVAVATHSGKYTYLRRPRFNFFEEETYIRTREVQQDWLKAQTRIPAMTVIGPQNFVPTQEFTQLHNTSAEGFFVLKYNYSPSDLAVWQRGSTKSYGMFQSLYPEPTIQELGPWVSLKQMLLASDISLLRGVINYVLAWMVGDKDNPPRPPKKDSSGAIIQQSTMDMVKDQLKDPRLVRSAQVLELVLPYYVEPKIIIPDLKALDNVSKYTQADLAIMNSFGIFAFYERQKREIEKLSITNFEQYLSFLRQQHVVKFIKKMVKQIIKRNPGKLTYEPTMRLNPLNTKDMVFRNALLEIAKIGRASSETLQRGYGLEPGVEASRIRDEQEDGRKGLYDANVPVQFNQAVTDPEGGRPSGSPDEKQRQRPTIDERVKSGE